MKKFQIVILFLFLLSCSSNQAVIPTLPPATTLPTFNPPPTESAVPATQTLTPAVPTPMATPLPTWTPLPTYVPTNDVIILRNSVMGQLNCLLPCWGGVTPGKTNWQQTRQLLEPLSGFVSLNVSENVNCDFGQCNIIKWSLPPNTQAEGNFYVNVPDNMLHFIDIDVWKKNDKDINFTKGLKMSSIFKLYGYPTLLAFHANLDAPGSEALETVLVYPTRQFMIVYWKNAKVVGDKLVSCKDYTHVKMIVVDNVDQLMSFDAISKAVETKDLDINQKHKSAYEALGMTDSAFYEYFSQKKEPCISTPINIWTP